MSIYQHFSDKEITILQERANRVASDNTVQDDVDTIDALVITIYNERYALPVEHIVTIYENIPVVPVPSVPPHIRGIANLRGHITPVIDPAFLLDIPGNDTGLENYYLIVLSHETRTGALLVEKLGDILAFNREQLKSMSLETQEKTSLIKGITPSGEALLDILAILNVD